MNHVSKNFQSEIFRWHSWPDKSRTVFLEWRIINFAPAIDETSKGLNHWKFLDAIFLGLKFHQCANNSANVSKTRPAVGASIFPSTLINLLLFTVLSWSSTICPFLPSNDVLILVGYSLPAVVIGAMMTVRICLFISSGHAK